jgi:TRAP-type C4-dicarboxylate transport system permease large subunit
MVVNMEVGMCHPPVGLNLYVASGITKMGITELTVAVWPWLLSMLCFLGGDLLARPVALVPVCDKGPAVPGSCFLWCRA